MITTRLRCRKCGQTQISVHPATCEYLECGACHHMNPAPYAPPRQFSGDRKDRLDMILRQARNLRGDEAEQAWFRLCRELEALAHPEARMPRFNPLLHALWIAASNDLT